MSAVARAGLWGALQRSKIYINRFTQEAAVRGPSRLPRQHMAGLTNQSVVVKGETITLWTDGQLASCPVLSRTRTLCLAPPSLMLLSCYLGPFGRFDLQKQIKPISSCYLTVCCSGPPAGPVGEPSRPGTFSG